MLHYILTNDLNTIQLQNRRWLLEAMLDLHRGSGDVSTTVKNRAKELSRDLLFDNEVDINELNRIIDKLADSLPKNKQIDKENIFVINDLRMRLTVVLNWLGVDLFNDVSCNINPIYKYAGGVDVLLNFHTSPSQVMLEFRYLKIFTKLFSLGWSKIFYGNSVQLYAAFVLSVIPIEFNRSVLELARLQILLIQLLEYPPSELELRRYRENYLRLATKSLHTVGKTDEENLTISKFLIRSIPDELLVDLCTVKNRRTKLQVDQLNHYVMLSGTVEQMRRIPDMINII